MKMRPLGQSDLLVTPFCFGGNVFGWTIDEAQGFKILDAYLGEGFNFIDTANVYSTWVPGNKGGESETIIGNWLKKTGKRNNVILATKVGMDMGNGNQGLSRAQIIKQAEDSLKRLQVDTIDLYWSHTDDLETPMEEVLRAYQDLIHAGKIRSIGASNFSADRLKDALKVSRVNSLPRYEALQPNYNLYDRAEFEKDLRQVCLDHKLSVVNYFSLGSGFLTGKYRSSQDLSRSKRGSRVEKYLNTRGFSILKALDEVSEKYHATPAQVAIAWLLAQPVVTAPIASATSVEQLHDILKGVKIDLDHESLNKLNRPTEAI